jgi:hypothetical protein
VLEARIGEINKSSPVTNSSPGLDESVGHIPADEHGSLNDHLSVVDAGSFSECPSPETDTFDPYTPEPLSLSLSSQLRRLRERSYSASVLPRILDNVQTGRHIAVRLPKPSELSHLLMVFFRDYDAYFPFMSEARIVPRIYNALNKLDFEEERLVVYPNDDQVLLFALLCNMLAIAELLDPEISAQRNAKIGWWFYLQGSRLLRMLRSSPHLSIDLDLVQYHTLCACYLLMMECITSASESIFRAYQLGTKLMLNDESRWDKCHMQERSERRKTWWTIFFMERRISQKAGAPYFIRASEMMVDDFPTTIKKGVEREKLLVSSGAEFTEDDTHVLNYFHALVQLGRLWGEIWDTFFGVKKESSKDPQEIEIMDTRILYLQRNLPEDIKWSKNLKTETDRSAETEKNIRRRLQIHVVSFAYVANVDFTADNL